jgi:hypothetical protein
VTSDAVAGRGIPAGQALRQASASAGNRRQLGMVTVEIALASLAAAAALVLLAWILTVVMLLARCNDLATSVARQEARGDQAAVAKILQGRPTGAKVAVRQQAEQITVTVDLAARPWADWLPSVPLSTSATVIREPS